MSVILSNTPTAKVEVSIYGLLRHVELPNVRSVGPRLKAIQRRYWSLTGRELPYPEAIRVLDQLIADRDDSPHPWAYSRIADYLIRSEYGIEAINDIVGHLSRGGSVEKCPGLEPADRASVLDLMPPRSYRPDPGRYSRPDWEEDREDPCGR